jgi:phage shock protein A
MSILRKLWTAARGGAAEAGQAAIDNQALRILDQEIRDAEGALDKARDELASIVARRTLTERKLGELKAKIAEYEEHAARALDQGDEVLARDVAQRIAEWEADLAASEKLIAESRSAETRMRATVTATESKIESLKREVETVKATEAVQAAQAAVASRHSGVNSALGDATQSLERIRRRQAERGARMEAAEELEKAKTGADLEERLAGLGIGGKASSGDDVLARIRAKRQG